MLRHNDIPEDIEFIMSAYLFEGALTAIARLRSAEVGLATVTTEGEEVKIARLLITTEARRHAWIVGRFVSRTKITLVGDGDGKGDPSGRLNTPTLAFARMGHPFSWPRTEWVCGAPGSAFLYGKPIFQGRPDVI